MKGGGRGHTREYGLSRSEIFIFSSTKEKSVFADVSIRDLFPVVKCCPLLTDGREGKNFLSSSNQQWVVFHSSRGTISTHFSRRQRVLGTPSCLAGTFHTARRGRSTMAQAKMCCAQVASRWGKLQINVRMKTRFIPLLYRDDC